MSVESSSAALAPSLSTATCAQYDVLRDKLISAWPLVADRPDGEQALAAMLNVSVQEVETMLGMAGTLEQAELARIKAEVEGKTLEPIARSTALKLVQRIAAQSDNVDAFEAAELLRPIIRVLENADRVRLAEREKDPKAGLAVFNIVFVSGGMEATVIEEALPVVLDVSTSFVADSDGGDL